MRILTAAFRVASRRLLGRGRATVLSLAIGVLVFGLLGFAVSSMASSPNNPQVQVAQAMGSQTQAVVRLAGTAPVRQDSVGDHTIPVDEDDGQIGTSADYAGNLADVTGGEVLHTFDAAVQVSSNSLTVTSVLATVVDADALPSDVLAWELRGDLPITA